MIRRERLGNGFIRLNLRAMGISNLCWDKENGRYRSLQFYDFDGFPSPSKLEEILNIFPYDCLAYKTKNGIHFISFTLLDKLRISKSRALEVSKGLNQDYWCSKPYLILRISPKWKKRLFRKKYKVKSEKPIFFELIKTPRANHPISLRHLEFYHKNMGLPNEIYEIYSKCPMKAFPIRIHHYKARDKPNV